MAIRQEAINLILDTLKPEDLVVACNGKISRELFELRVERGEPTDDFYMLGSMGCAIPLALGVAMNTHKKVVCLVGDGNLLMKLGALATVRSKNLKNLYIYVLNNYAHGSTGGQPTNMLAVRHALPFGVNFRIMDLEPGERPNLGRPTISAKQITANFRNKIYAS